jgi:uncharacterized protein
MKTIAILGASQQRSKFGNKAVRAYLHAGWEVHPVNLSGEEVEGLPTVRRLDEVPGGLDRISVYLPPPVTRELLGEIAARGAGEVWFNPGAADPGVVAEARRRGIPVHEGCSIVDLGLSPAQFP